MKVVHVTYSAKGGAGIAAKRLHYALQKGGIQSAFLSTNLTINFDNEIKTDSFFSYRRASLFKRIILRLNPILSLTKKQKILNDFYYIEKKGFEVLSLPFSKFKLHKHQLVKEADVVHLHWISGIVDYPTFFKICKKPIVWTLHDMNPFLGVFHYQNNMKTASKELLEINKEVLKIYERSIQRIEKIIVVTPSHWLSRQSLNYRLLNKFQHKHISNTIDTNNFKILNKKDLREKYNINNKRFVLLFVSESIDNYRKGFDILLEAIHNIKDIELTVLAIGNGEVHLKQKNIEVIELGKISNQKQLIEVYNLADVFVLPSREDNLPNVILESYACGLPVVSFNIGGVKEHVLTDITGINVGQIDSQKLTEAVVKMHHQINKYNSEAIRNYAKENFSLSNQSSKYIEVYKSLLE